MKRFVPWLLLSTAVLFIGLGVWRSEWSIVLSRAIYICLTCIGIG